MRAARGRIGTKESLPQRLSRHAAIRPVVARRHSFQTGCLRYFEVKFASVSVPPQELVTRPDADGTVVILIPETPDEERQAQTLAKSEALRARADRLFGIPECAEGLMSKRVAVGTLAVNSAGELGLEY